MTKGAIQPMPMTKRQRKASRPKKEMDIGTAATTSRWQHAMDRMRKGETVMKRKYSTRKDGSQAIEVVRRKIKGNRLITRVENQGGVTKTSKRLGKK